MPCWLRAICVFIFHYLLYFWHNNFGTKGNHFPYLLSSKHNAGLQKGEGSQAPHHISWQRACSRTSQSANIPIKAFMVAGWEPSASCSGEVRACQPPSHQGVAIRKGANGVPAMWGLVNPLTQQVACNILHPKQHTLNAEGRPHFSRWVINIHSILDSSLSSFMQWHIPHLSNLEFITSGSPILTQSLQAAPQWQVSTVEPSQSCTWLPFIPLLQKPKNIALFSFPCFQYATNGVISCWFSSTACIPQAQWKPTP